jgi:hypothetical protein
MAIARRQMLQLLAALLVAIALACGGATLALAGDWVWFPAGWSWCDWYQSWVSKDAQYEWAYWCYSDTWQNWVRVDHLPDGTDTSPQPIA